MLLLTELLPLAQSAPSALEVLHLNVLFSLLHVQLMRNNIKLLLSRGKKLNFTSDLKKALPLHPEEFPPLELPSRTQPP